MGKTNNTADLTTLSPEELLAFAQTSKAKVAELEAKLIEGATDIDKAVASVGELKAKINETEGKVGTLETSIAELTTERDAAKADLEEALQLNEELQESLENKAKGPSLPEVKHNKETYVVSIPSFRHNGEVHTAESLKKNPALIADLIEQGSGVLTLKA